MPEYMLPEIQRTSLTAVVLTLKCLGVHDVIRYIDSHSVCFLFVVTVVSTVTGCFSFY